MKAYLTKRYWFSASHRLHNPELNAEENRQTYGKCNNPYGHGHNYAVEVTVSGEVDPETGMVCDLGALDAAVQREILDRFEHEHLNALPEFESKVPTSENLAALICEILKRQFSAAHLEKVRLRETSRNSFEFGSSGEPLH